MTNRSKAKGSAWERRLVDHLVASGFPHAERRVLEGKNDRGDVSGIPGVVLEAKSCTRLELAKWVDEMVKERANAGAQVGAVVFPRKAHATGRAYAVMELDCFLDLIR